MCRKKRYNYNMKEKFKNEHLNILAQFGLKPQEAVVFLSCLQLGEASVGQIAKDSGIQRTFVYDVVADLVGKGIFSQTETEGVKKYSSISIDQFKQKQLEKFKEFEGIIPEIRVLQSSKGDQPKVKFFTGREGIITTLYDPINLLKKGDEVLAYATGRGFYEQEKEFADQYMKDRVKKGIWSRSIATNAAETRYFTDKNEEQMRETRLVPIDKFDFTNEINIYANKVSIMSMKEELLAIIIESESVAKTQRMIFELAWRGAEGYQTISNS